MKLYHVDVGDLTDPTLGMDAVSFVRRPAIRRGFLHFSENKLKRMAFASLMDEEKRICTGPIAIPNEPIWRYDPTSGEEFYVTFTRECIEEMVTKYMAQGRANAVDVEHSGELEQGVILVELYLIDHERGICPVEFADLPDGTLIGSYKVLNDEIWDLVKRGEILGFSLSCEALLTQPEEYEEPFDDSFDFEILFNDMKKHSTSLLFRAAQFLLRFSEVKCKDGTTLNVDGDVKAGVSVLLADGTPFEGQAELEDGSVITAEKGIISEVKPAEAPTEEPIEEAEAEAPKEEAEAPEEPKEEEKPAEEEAPKEEAEEAPAEEAPAEEPVEAAEAPTEEAPAEEAPAEEAPAEEPVEAAEAPAEEATEEVAEEPDYDMLRIQEELGTANAQLSEVKKRNAVLEQENEDLRKKLAERDVQDIESNATMQFTAGRRPNMDSAKPTEGKDWFQQLLEQ